MLYKCLVLLSLAVILLFNTKTCSSEKLCRIRNLNPYPSKVFDFWAGFFCYNYTPTTRLNFKYTDFSSAPYHNYSIPVKKINDSFLITFNHKDTNSLPFVHKSFKTDHFFEKWLTCCEEAYDCCNNYMTEENVNPSDEYPCPAIWDGWSCWAPAKPDTISKQTCSSQAYSSDSDVCELQSEKYCFPNGTWLQQTDYAPCAIAPTLRSRHTYNVISLGVAAALSLPAVLIFFSWAKFRKNLRFVLHRNLILIIIIRSILTIMSKKLIILDTLNTDESKTTVMDENSAGCRILAFFENAAKNGMYACMLADGFYLHKLIVRPFADDPNLIIIYAVVFVLTFLPSVIWAAMREVHGGQECWMVDSTNDQWIIDGFRICILAINFLLLFDIIRVMIMKVKRGTMSEQAKSTLKATLFLIPLFGVHIIIITNRKMVPSNTCEAQDIYYYLSYTVEALQGVMVSILFCYINGEVQAELQNSFRKFVLRLESRFNINLQRTKHNNRRRTTAATFC